MGTVQGSGQINNQRVFSYSWGPLTTTNAVGNGIAVPASFVRKSIQATGTFQTTTAATVAMQGSNDGGTTWTPLQNLQGTVIGLTSAGKQLDSIADNALLIRPSVSGGDSGTSITVRLVANEGM